MADPVVILSYARTPDGRVPGGAERRQARPRSGAAAVRAAVERAGVGGNDVDQIVMGCVLPAGLGQAPARQAAIGRRPAARRHRDDGQQDVRVGDARPRSWRTTR